jgi:hypothetical protein
MSHHDFNLPEDLPRDSYILLVNGAPIGGIEARQMTMPPDYKPVASIINDQIRLLGVKQALQGDHLAIDIAWQGVHPATNDYTLFIQLLDNQAVRKTGIDVAPERGFTTLDNKEVMLTHHLVPLTAEMRPGSYTVLIGLYYFVGDKFYGVGSVILNEPVVLEQPTASLNSFSPLADD